MVASPLVELDIESGRKLIRELDANKFPVVAALWLYLTEPNEWRLVIASPLVEKLGPRAAYRRVQEAIARTQTAIALKNVTVISPDEDPVRLFRRALRTGPGLSDTRFTGNTINGTFIEDAYIYRIA